MGMFKNAKIYVAGHSGLLGSALMKKLHAYGYTNILTRTHAQLDLVKQDEVFIFIENEKPDYIFLAAGLSGGIMANNSYPATFYYTNISIQNNVFHAAQKYNVKHVVYYGSSCIYPRTCPQPIKEKYLLTGDIEHTSEAYAISKISGVFACRAYNNQFKTNRFIALVPNSIYGPHDNFDLEQSHVLSALINRFVTAKADKSKSVQLWGSGDPRREFIFSEDVADASIFAVNNADKFSNTHYNIGTGVDYSIQEFAILIAKIVGYNGKIVWDTSKPDGTPQKLLDSTRFQALGWKAYKDLESGTKYTVDWYVRNVFDSNRQ